jgi:hypothetical protein
MKGFGVDDLSKEVICYEQVSVEDINRVIKGGFFPESINAVIVCDAKKVREQLEKIGPYEEVYYKDPLVRGDFLFFF